MAENITGPRVITKRTVETVEGDKRTITTDERIEIGGDGPSYRDNPPPYSNNPEDPSNEPYEPPKKKEPTLSLFGDMVYEPIGSKSCWHRPDFVKDYQELSTRQKTLVWILSTILIGGGILGCVLAAKSGGYSSSSEPITNKPSTGIKTNTTEKTTPLTVKTTISTTKITTTATTTTTFKPCKDTQWQCDSGDCIHISDVCNYECDCQDKSDEYSDRADCRDRNSRCKD